MHRRALAIWHDDIYFKSRTSAWPKKFNCQRQTNDNFLIYSFRERLKWDVKTVPIMISFKSHFEFTCEVQACGHKGPPSCDDAIERKANVNMVKHFIVFVPFVAGLTPFGDAWNMFWFVYAKRQLSPMAREWNETTHNGISLAVDLRRSILSSRSPSTSLSPFITRMKSPFYDQTPLIKTIKVPNVLFFFHPFTSTAKTALLN